MKRSTGWYLSGGTRTSSEIETDKFNIFENIKSNSELLKIIKYHGIINDLEASNPLNFKPSISDEKTLLLN